MTTQRKTRSTVGVMGRIAVETRDADTGALIPTECGETPNILLDVGLEELARVIAQTAASVGYEIQVGTGTSAFDGTESALETPVYKAVVTSQNATGTQVSIALFIDRNSANGYTLTEAGLLHNGVVIDRSLITAVNKTSGKTVTVTVTLTLAR